MAAMAAAGGALIHLSTDIMQAGIHCTFGVLIIFGLIVTRPDHSMGMRLSYLLGLSALMGVGTGPLLQHVIAVNPCVLVTALVGSTVIIVSLTISSLLAERAKWLHMRGTLRSLLTTLSVRSVTHFYFGLSMFFYAQVQIELFLLCGFVLCQTQLTIEKRRFGHKDFVAHALDLFLNHINIFWRVLIILTQKEQELQRTQIN